MATYTLVFHNADGRQTQNLADFADDTSAILGASGALTADVHVIVIGRGSDENVACVGAWDRDERGMPRWFAVE
jgi:hypothetical protein